LTIHRLEELSTPQLDALDRACTVVILTVSPLETHGPHLPLGVDAFTARHFSESIAAQLVAGRPGWSVVLAPTLHLGSFTFDSVGTVAVRQRVVRDAVVDYGSALSRAGFRYVLVSNGHGGPGHLVALEEAAAIVSRRHRITMASFSGHLAWEFLRGRLLPRIEAGLGRPLSESERAAFSEDAHGGWWETSIMLVLRPDLVDAGYRQLPAARYSFTERLRPNYAARRGGPGYVGHPAMADPAFARVTSQVLMDEAMALVNGLLDGRLRPSDRRSPFFAIPFFRTSFRPIASSAAALLAALAAWRILGRQRRPR
jgi:creatinine amidohydrolase